jgi:hypothetical protein
MISSTMFGEFAEIGKKNTKDFRGASYYGCGIQKT